MRDRVIREMLNWDAPFTEAGAESWQSQVTAIVTTFERPRCVLRLLQSVRRFFPGLKILVCDSSESPLFGDGEEVRRGIVWFHLPDRFEHTVGAGRNYLLEKVETKFFFLCDDDHAINSHTDIGALYGFLLRHDYDLVGGCQGRGDLGTAVFEQRGDTVYQRFYRHHGRIEAGVVRCDRVSNTFLARTASVRRVGWEHRVYANEHAEFFLRASRQGLKIAQMGAVYVDHDRRCEEATAGLGRILGRFLPHRDRDYHQKMVDGTGPLGNPSDRARELERKFCFEKNGIRGIKSDARLVDKIRLKRLLRQS